MKTMNAVALLASLVLFTIYSPHAHAAEITEVQIDGAWSKVDRNSILVKVTGDQMLDELDNTLELLSMERVRSIPQIGWYMIRIPRDLGVLEAIDSIQARSSIVISSQPNYYYSSALEQVDETHWDSLWHLHPVDSLPQREYSKHTGMHLSAAWDIEEGSEDVVMAILDSGIPLDSAAKPTHPDLNDTNRIILGKNFADPTCTDDTCLADKFGHGTQMATAAAADLDGSGSVGVNYKGKILVLVTGNQVEGCSFARAMGLVYAADQGAEVANASWHHHGGDQYCSLIAVDSCMEDAVKYCLDSGVVICAAKGNVLLQHHNMPALFASYGTDTSYEDGYSNVIAVGGLATGGRKYGSLSSDEGRTTVVAPAQEVFTPCLQTKCDPPYGWFQGTSLATALVTGLVGLILSQDPDLTPGEVRDILIETADKIWQNPDEPAYADSIVLGDACWSDTIKWTDSSWHPHYGQGRVNAYKALGGKLDTLESETWADTVWVSETFIPSGDTVTVDSGTQIMISRYDLRARGVDEDLAEIEVAGVLRLLGTSAKRIILQPAAEADTPAWYGIHVKAGGRLTVNYTDIKNAKVAITLDSGAILDTVVGTNLANCESVMRIDDHIIVLQDVTVTGTGSYVVSGGEGSRLDVIGSLDIEGSLTSPAIFTSANDSLAWRGINIYDGATASFQHCKFEDMSHGIRIIGADSVTIDSCEFDNIGNVAISVEAADDSITPSGTVISNCWFEDPALSSSCAVVIDTNATASMSKLTITGLPLGIVFDGGWGDVEDALILSADTAVIVDAGDSTVSLHEVYVFGFGTLKGIRAKSGVLKLNHCDISALAYTGVDAYSGTAEIWLDSSVVKGHPTSSAAVSIGPDARISARNTIVEDSWIGFEIDGDGLDSLMGCHAINNTLKGVDWHGSGPDYMYRSLIRNDSTTSSNYGVHVYKQSIKSQRDTIRGGYNWCFDFYSATNSNLTATIDDLTIEGDGEAQWGLILNGPASTGDVATVTDSRVEDVFTGAHLYMRWLEANVEACSFVSTGNSTATPIGVKDMGSTTGSFECNAVMDQKTTLVEVGYNSGIDYEQLNSIYVTEPDSLASTDYVKYAYSGSADFTDNYWGTTDSSDIADRMSGTVNFYPFETTAPSCLDGPPEKHAADETVRIADEILPTTFELMPSRPNPFNPTTTIQFALPIDQDVRILIYNILGQSVRTFDLGTVSAGVREVTWDGRDDQGNRSGSGVYFYRIITPEFTDTRKMLLLK